MWIRGGFKKLSNSNPFSTKRYEDWRGSPLIWVSPQARLLAQERSFYVSGSRGCGKTSVLQSLHWRERLENRSLLDQIDGAPFQCVGIYLHTPHVLDDQFGGFDWSVLGYDDTKSEQLEFQIFTIFIEYLAIKSLCDALIAFRHSGHIKYDIVAEDRLVSRLRKDFPDIEEILRGHEEAGSVGIPALADVFRNVTDGILRASTRQLSPSWFEGLNLESSGNGIVRFLTAVYECFSIEESVFQHVKILIDDAQILSKKRQVYLNSLVRHQRERTSSSAIGRVTWAVAFIQGKFESSETIWDGESLVVDDREIVEMDKDYRQDFGAFKDLCDEISNLRIGAASSTGGIEEVAKRPGFKVHEKLGRCGVNELIAEAGKRSKRNEWKAFEGRTGDFSKIWQKVHPTSRGMRYYENYMFESGFSGGGSKPEKWIKNVNLDSLRKYERAAFLNICDQFRLNVHYFGSDVLLRLCDGRIRDFLALMSGIHEEYVDKDPQRKTDTINELSYLRRAIPRRIQSSGIKRASSKKIQGIGSQVDQLTSEISSLIQCLGELTQALQVNYRNARSLSIPERGSFRISFPGKPGNVVEMRDRLPEEQARGYLLLREVLREAVSNGLLQINESEGNRKADLKNAVQGVNSRHVEVRLHRSFAPAFGYSYLGGITRVPIQAANLVAVVKTPENVSPREWAQSEASKIDKNYPESGNLPLFDLEV